MQSNPRHRAGLIAGQALSWGPPLLAGLVYFAAYHPGFTNHDSQSIWLNAFQHVRDPANAPLMDWYAPGLTVLRLLALQSGLGVAGYHAVFCTLTYGSWAALVAALLRRPGRRACAHALLLLPFLGANLAFQVSDVWVAVGLAWMIVALRLDAGSLGKVWIWLAPLLYFAGSLMVLGARRNALLALPVFVVVPLVFRCHASPTVRRLCAAAPLAALLVNQGVNASLPIQREYKREVYMVFETIGVWKSLAAGKADDVLAGFERPRVFELLPHPPAYYLERWNPADVDALIWDLPEFEDRSLFIADHAAEIRADFFRTVARHPLHYARVKLLFTLNGLGLTPPDAPPVSPPAHRAWIDQLEIPLHPSPLAARHTTRLLAFNDRTRAYWWPLSAPLAWWMAGLVVFFWRREQGRVTPLDGAWLTLLAAYYVTLLFFAPVYLPRYVFPVWVVLGVGTIRLLLGDGTDGSQAPPVDGKCRRRANRP